MSKYKCPICGREYDTIKEVKKCLELCEKNVEKTKALNEADNNVKLAYEQLKKAVDEYNNLGGLNKYTSTLSRQFESKINEQEIKKPVTNSTTKDSFKDTFENFIKNEMNDFIKKEEKSKKKTFSSIDNLLIQIKEEIPKIKDSKERKFYEELVKEFSSEYKTLSEKEKKFLNDIVHAILFEI